MSMNVVLADEGGTPAERSRASTYIEDRGPFGGNSIKLLAKREVNVAQLQEELTQRTKTQVQVSLQVDPENHRRIATEASPLAVYISPANTNERVAQAVLDAHVAKQVGGRPVAGASQEQTGFNPASLPEGAQDLISKLEKGETLKTAESSDLLRALLGISPS